MKDGETKHYHIRILEDGRIFFGDDFPELTDQIVFDLKQPERAKDIYRLLEEHLPDEFWDIVKRTMFNLDDEKEPDETT